MDLSKRPPAGHYRRYNFYAFEPSPPPRPPLPSRRAICGALPSSIKLAPLAGPLQPAGEDMEKTSLPGRMQLQELPEKNGDLQTQRKLESGAGLILADTEGEAQIQDRLHLSAGWTSAGEHGEVGTVRRGVLKFEAMAAMNSSTSTRSHDPDRTCAKRRKIEPSMHSPARAPRLRSRRQPTLLSPPRAINTAGVRAGTSRVRPTHYRSSRQASSAPCSPR
jgi:hypothetical protein